VVDFFFAYCVSKYKKPEKTNIDYTNLSPNQDVDENGVSGIYRGKDPPRKFSKSLKMDWYMIWAVYTNF
jgi:hypothetical protein